MSQKYYQREGCAVLYTADEEDGKIAVCPQGGGFLRYMTASEFSEMFTEVVPNLSMRKGTVTADFLPRGVAIPCYSNGMRWNGWGMPSFDRVGVDLVIPALELGLPIEYHFEANTLVMQNPEYDPNYPEDLESYENLKLLRIDPFSADIDGEPILLWSVGQNWTWNSVEFSEIVE